MRSLYLPAAVLAIAVGVWAAFWAAGSVRVDAQPATPNITIAGPGPGFSVPIGSNFDVSISIDSGATAFNTFQVEVDVPAGLTFVSGTHQATGTLPECFTWALETPGPTRANTACGHIPPDTAFTGLVETITLRCDSVGTYPLNLVDYNGDLINGSYLLDANGPVTTNTTPDGEQTVDCGGGGPPPNTPTPSGSTPTAPTPTASTAGPSPTPGAVPPGMEGVSLASGCQFLAWTGQDGTSPGVLASQVTPPESLVSLWAQQPAPTWRGYSPEFPQVSDMEPVNLLDVVAFCMTGPGQFVRPAI